MSNAINRLRLRRALEQLDGEVLDLLADDVLGYQDYKTGAEYVTGYRLGSFSSLSPKAPFTDNVSIPKGTRVRITSTGDSYSGNGNQMVQALITSTGAIRWFPAGEGNFIPVAWLTPEAEAALKSSVEAEESPEIKALVKREIEREAREASASDGRPAKVSRAKLGGSDGDQGMAAADKAALATGLISSLVQTAGSIAASVQKKDEEAAKVKKEEAAVAAAKAESDAITDARIKADQATQQARAAAAAAKAHPGDAAYGGKARNAAKKAAELETIARAMETKAGIRPTSTQAAAMQQQQAMAKAEAEKNKPSFFRRIPWYGWVGIGLGTVGLGVGGYFVFRHKGARA